MATIQQGKIHNVWHPTKNYYACKKKKKLENTTHNEEKS